MLFQLENHGTKHLANIQILQGQNSCFRGPGSNVTRPLLKGEQWQCRTHQTARDLNRTSTLVFKIIRQFSPRYVPIQPTSASNQQLNPSLVRQPGNKSYDVFFRLPIIIINSIFEPRVKCRFRFHSQRGEIHMIEIRWKEQRVRKARAHPYGGNLCGPVHKRKQSISIKNNVIKRSLYSTERPLICVKWFFLVNGCSNRACGSYLSTSIFYSSAVQPTLKEPQGICVIDSTKHSILTVNNHTLSACSAEILEILSITLSVVHDLIIVLPQPRRWRDLCFVAPYFRNCQSKKLCIRKRLHAKIDYSTKIRNHSRVGKVKDTYDW